LDDILGLGAGVTTTTCFIPPKREFLSAANAKGLEITGTFARRSGKIMMDMTLTNRAMQNMSEFGIQLNSNSFGLQPEQALNVPAVIANKSVEVSLALVSKKESVMKMEPLTNLQVAVKNNIGVFYFAAIVPMHVFFVEQGKMERKEFLTTWKNIPAENEVQYTLDNCECNADGASTKMEQNNVFTVAKRKVDGQDMVYQSLKFTNGLWALAELKIKPGSPTIGLAIKSRATDVIKGIYEAYNDILHN